ncbi:MAG: YihY/virulence factor BrkB family protein [Clostridia bacterium]|nr:YihY/virulence factor BrkB family protein [Clostridia bacterium]
METLVYHLTALKDKVAATVKYYSDKRFSTIAGTLVYFLLMSIAPFTLWLTLVFGNVDAERFLSHELFDSVSPVLRYMKQSAESAVSGAGIIFLLTTLYSSTNFFYHLRRSGEIIYGSKRVKEGIKLRLVSLLLIAATIVLVALTAALSVAGATVLNAFLPEILSNIISLIFLTALLFVVAIVLNLVACPYKLKISQVLTGSLLTTVLWLIFSVGFAVYTQFANPERLYGRIAALIIFLLWSYVMISCFVIGMIKNGSFVPKNLQIKSLF